VSSDGTHTQEIERLWGELKQMKKNEEVSKLSEWKSIYLNLNCAI
jgi:hypothetical protein